LAASGGMGFLLYYPLKQGLKQKQARKNEKVLNLFLLYYPLKQGLKHPPIKGKPERRRVFTLLSIKTRIETALEGNIVKIAIIVFTLLSIKTRIETAKRNPAAMAGVRFLLYYPLKQGLKLTYGSSW